MLSGFIHAGIDACKGRDGLPVGEPRDIADLSDELRPKGLPDAAHGHDRIVFRKCGGELIHLAADADGGLSERAELADAHFDEVLIGLFLWEHRNKFPGSLEKLLCLRLAEVIAFPPAEGPVTLGEGFQAGFADTVDMPEGSGKVDPFLKTVLAGGAGKKGVHARIGHIQERDEVVPGSDLLFGKEVHLRVERFKLGSNVIHRRILSQIGPVVKSVAGDLSGIGGIGLDLADGVIAKVADEVWVDSGDEDAGVSRAAKDGLVIAAGAFHNSPGIAVKGEDVFLKAVQSAERVGHIKGLPEGDAAGLQDRHGALAL